MLAFEGENMLAFGDCADVRERLVTAPYQLPTTLRQGYNFLHQIPTLTVPSIVAPGREVQRDGRLIGRRRRHEM